MFGGNIGIHTSERTYAHLSEITTSVETGAGDGGNIDIPRIKKDESEKSTIPRFVVLNRSTIRANAFEGNGGKIEITGKDVLISSGTIIEASSEKGIDGEILVSSPDSDLITDLVTLRTNFLDASSLLAQSCSARTARAGSLVVRGRDRIPAAPADAPLRGFYLGGDEPPAVSSAREPTWYGDGLSSGDLGP